MKKNIVSKFLMNLKIFLALILVLFIIAISMGLASHDANVKKFTYIYVTVALGHMLLNAFTIRRDKESLIILLLSSFEIVILYGIIFIYFLAP